MVALYMAGELYKEDDAQLAQIYMNEFSAWLEEVKMSGNRANVNRNGSGKWVSEKGVVLMEVFECGKVFYSFSSRFVQVRI